MDKQEKTTDRITLRLPHTLHVRLTEIARESGSIEAASLNGTIVHFLQKCVELHDKEKSSGQPIPTALVHART
jgi:hypothetical protein